MRVFPLICGITLFSLSCVSAQGEKEDVPLAERLVDEQVMMPAMTGEIIRRHYEKWTGKRVIVSNAALGRSIVFIHKPPLTYAEAAQLLEKTCLLEGIVFVPSGRNEVKMVLADDVKPQGVQLYKEAELLPQGDDVVSYLMKFEHISAEDAQRAFSSVSGNVKPHGSVTVIDNINSIIFTEKASLVRSLLDVKEVIDIPQSRVTSKMISLRHADSEELAAQLQQIISSQAEEQAPIVRQGQAQRGNAQNGGQGRGNGNGNNANPNGNNANGNAGQDQGGGQVQSLNVVANPRVNSIFVMGRQIDIVFVENLIEMFDQPAEQRNFFTFKLDYLPVGEFLSIAESGIQRTLGDDEQGGGTAANNQAANNQQNGDSSGIDNAVLGDSERPEQPQSLIVGKTLLVADNTNNTLIVQGPPQSIDVVRTLIGELDVPAQQVRISAMFGRYSMDGERTIGVDFARAFSGSDNEGFATQSSTGFPLIANPANLTDPTLFPTPADGIGGLSFYGTIGDNFFAFLRALESKGKFKLLSRPTLYTTNNRKALLSSGQRIAVPTSTLSETVAAGTVSQNTNIEFRDVLLKFEVIPLVNSEDEITLKISFLNDNVVGNQTINGNTVGQLFSTTNKETSKDELVILIQPRIIENRTQVQDLDRIHRAEFEVYDEYKEGLLPAKKKKEKPTRNTTRPTVQSPEFLQQDNPS